MDSPTLKNKPISLVSLYINTWQIIKANWLNSLKILFFVVVLCLILFTLLVFLWGILVKFNINNIPDLVAVRLFWQLIAGLVYFLISALIQFLLLNLFLNPSLKFLENLKAFKKYFWQFCCLTIILNVIFFFFSVPLYVGFFFYSLDNIFLGIISIILGYLLIILYVSYLLFSPILLIEKNLTCLESMKSSILLASNHAFNIFWKILILAIILILLNIAALFVLNLPYLGLPLAIFILCFMVLLIFANVFALYQNFKALKNA